MSSTGTRVAKAAGIIMVAMFLSRVLGYVREAYLAAEFGRTAYTDAYIAAFNIPDFLYNLLVGGALSSGFIPVFSGYLAKNREKEAWRVASTVVNIVIIFFIIGIAFGMTYTEQLIKLVAKDFPADTAELTVQLTRIMLPFVVFTGLNGLMMGILNSYQEFKAPALGSVIYNVGILVVGIYLSSQAPTKEMGIQGFAIAVIVGILGNFFVQFPALIKTGLRYRPILDLFHPGVKKMVILMLPATLGLAVAQINLIVNQNFASGLAEGSITALRLANRLMQLPLGVFAVSVAMAAFPTMTAMAARNEMQDFKKTFNMGLRSIFFVTIPAAAGLIALSVPIVRLLFEHNEFTHSDTLVTAKVLIFYSIGLVAHSAVQIIVRGFYSWHDTLTPVIIALTTMGLNFLLNYLFIEPLGSSGLAFAYTLVGFFNMLSLLWLLRKKIGPMNGRKLLNSFLTISVASAIMGVISYGVAQGLETVLDIEKSFNQLIQVGTAVTVGVIVYAVITLLLKMEEADVVMGILKRKFLNR